MSITVSIVTGGSNFAATSAPDLNGVATDFISNGVVGAITLNTGSGGTGAFAVNAESSPTMQVRITQGVLYQLATPSGSTQQSIRVYMNAFTDVTCPNNVSGSTRYAWIYLNLDQTLLANPDVNKSTVGTFVVNSSSSSTSDTSGTVPAAGQLLAVVTLINNVASVTNANISDKRVQAGVNTGTVGSTSLAAGAIVLGYVEQTSTQTGISTSNVQVTGQTLTITMPNTTRQVRIKGQAINLSIAGAGQGAFLSVWDGTVGSGTLVVEGSAYMPTTGTACSINVERIVTLTPGTVKTYNLGTKVSGGTGTLGNDPISSTLTVELV